MGYMIAAGLFVGSLVVGIITAVTSPVEPVAKAAGEVLQVTAEQVPNLLVKTKDGVVKLTDFIPTKEGE